MPVYYIFTTQDREETWSEYWNSYRRATYGVTYRVEAEDENEALAIYHRNEAEVYDEEWEDDEILDNDFIETIDLVESTTRNEEFEEIREAPFTSPRRGISAGRTRIVLSSIAYHDNDDPDWEV